MDTTCGKADRYTFIDETRAIAILMVVIAHMCNAAGLSNPVRDWFNPFMISIFFMTSGYVQSRSKHSVENFKKNVTSRLKHLAVPYLFFSIIPALLQMIMAYEQGRSIKKAALGLLVDFATLKGFGPMWFLPAMFFASLGFSLIIGRKKFVHVLAAAAAILATCIAGGVVDCISVSGSVWLINYTAVFLKSVIGAGIMVLGYYILPLLGKLIKPYLMVLTASICLAGSVAVARVYNLDLNMLAFGRMPILFFVDTILGTVFVVLCCRLADSLHAWHFLAYLGQNSLTILCTHTEWFIVPLIQLGFTSLAGQAAVAGGRYYMELVIKLFFVVVAEMGVIELIQKYFPFIQGKSMNE